MAIQVVPLPPQPKINLAPPVMPGGSINLQGGYNPQQAGAGAPPVPSQASGIKQAPVGIKAVTPTTNVKPPPTTLPASQQAPSASQLLAQGFQPINGAQYYNKQLQQANFDRVTPIGNTLYGIPKKTTGTAIQPPPSPTTSSIGTTTGGTAPSGTGAGTGGNITLYDKTGNTQSVPANSPLANSLIASGNWGTTPVAQTAANSNQYGGANASGQLDTSGTQQALANNGLLGQLLSYALNKSSQPSADYTQQLNRANQYASDLNVLRQQEAQALAGNALNPIPLEFQQGRGQVLQTQYGQREQALANAYGAAAGLVPAATGQQQAQIGGLLSTAGALQPQLGAYGQAQYTPLGGLVGGGGAGAGVAPTDPFYQTLQGFAQSLANNQPSAIPASITGNPVLMNQLLQMTRQINPAFNFNIAQGVGAAQQGAASTQVGQVASYTSALQQGRNLQNQLNDLITSFGLNPYDLNVANAALQKIAANVSDPHYQALSNYINDIANTYAQILTPAGGSQTDTTRSIASSMINNTASGQSILATMQGLDQQAQAKIAGVPTALPTLGNQSGGTGTLDWNAILNYGH